MIRSAIEHILCYFANGAGVVLSESLKREIEQVKLRELRRRGIGQHTIENALHSHVRVRTYRKIVAAIEEYNRTTQKG